MALQTENLNRTQQGGVVAGSAVIMFAATGTTEGLFSGVMFAAAMVAILSALVLYTAAYRERKD